MNRPENSLNFTISLLQNKQQHVSESGKNFQSTLYKNYLEETYDKASKCTDFETGEIHVPTEPKKTKNPVLVVENNILLNLINILKRVKETTLTPEVKEDLTKNDYVSKISICEQPIQEEKGNCFNILLKSNEILNIELKSDLSTEVFEIFGAFVEMIKEYTKQSLEIDARKKNEKKFESIVDIFKSIHSDLGANSLLFTLNNKAHVLVDSERCAIYTYDKSNNEIAAIQGDVSVRISATNSIAGDCCSKNEIILIHDAYADERFNSKVDQATNFKTNNILCVPIRSQDNEILGAIQLINKKHNEVFTNEDAELILYFLKIATPLFEESNLFPNNFQQRKRSDEREFEPVALSKRKSSLSSVSIPAAVEEREDSDEE